MFDIFWGYFDVIWTYFDVFYFSYYFKLIWYILLFFEKNTYFHYLQHRSDLGNSTPWSASPRRFRRTNVRQKTAYVALVRQATLFSTVYRGATASGTVSRVPGRSTCIGHTKDELCRPSGGRVVTIRNFFFIWRWQSPKVPRNPIFEVRCFNFRFGHF